MKKALKVILILILVLLVGGSVTFPVIIAKKGNIGNQTLPSDFSTGIKKTAYLPTNSSTDLRLMTLNLLAHYPDWGGTDAHPRAKMFWAMMDAYAPDVIGVQEMCDQWYCCIMKNKGRYKMVHALTTGLFLRMTALLYNSDTVTLLKSGEQQYTKYDDGRLRRIVWGVFETKKTGAKFVVTSTHLNLLRYGLETDDLVTMKSQADEQIALDKQLAADYQCPVFSVGDFNAKERDSGDVAGDSSSVYQKLSTALTDTKTIARIKSFGAEKSTDNTSNDHIFLLGSATVLEYSMLTQTYMTRMSDHFPLFADIALSTN